MPSNHCTGHKAENYPVTCSDSGSYIDWPVPLFQSHYDGTDIKKYFQEKIKFVDIKHTLSPWIL